MRTISIVLLSLTLTACTGAAADRTTEAVAPTARGAGSSSDDGTGHGASAPGRMSASVRYEHIDRTAHSAKRPVGLCELLKFLDGGAGVYTVTGLTGQTERTEAGVSDGFTYVDLDLVRAWTEGAPEHVVARISGGPAGKGLTRGFAIHLAVGETLGVMLYAPTDANRGHHGMDTLGLFQQDERGGYHNGQLFLDAPRSLQEIGDVVRENAVAKGECPSDVLPFDNTVAPVFPAPGGAPTKPVRVVLNRAATSGPRDQTR